MIQYSVGLSFHLRNLTCNYRYVFPSGLKLICHNSSHWCGEMVVRSKVTVTFCPLKEPVIKVAGISWKHGFVYFAYQTYAAGGVESCQK